MATRSTIAIERKDGTVAQVYCHWDGYVPHVGRILLDHYSDPAKLEKLIALGDVSSLDRDIGEKHHFDMRTEGWTTFYGRDRGETRASARVFDSWQDYLQNGNKQEYNYVLRCGGLDTLNPVWEVAMDEGYVWPTGNKLTELVFVPLMDKIVEYAEFVLSHGATNLTSQQEHV